MVRPRLSTARPREGASPGPKPQNFAARTIQFDAARADLAVKAILIQILARSIRARLRPKILIHG